MISFRGTALLQMGSFASRAIKMQIRYSAGIQVFSTGTRGKRPPGETFRSFKIVPWYFENCYQSKTRKHLIGQEHFIPIENVVSDKKNIATSNCMLLLILEGWIFVSLVGMTYLLKFQNLNPESYLYYMP